ncbi:hypothetical protein BU25DRAFT_477949 [Macroventuria anomochaeta]|uniref:Uncharacterized protein n=1 Tax=Macroventuria anomochaeta TaxID=301207 RepID=A0ACB6RQ54_9PLEO|nr:uncharacterized protein BU25DRAFT_477949 [Macroventuria anomochaeta]KAF2623530.1 hypothetical protein BU25DRAFT_477949 [Macroventuria anomochaeta]
MNRVTHLTLGDTGRPEDRVVRIVNLHYETDSDDIHKFFGNDFTIVDFIRSVNPKTNKNTVDYVLFAIEHERINAQTLSGRQILDRQVKVLSAQGASASMSRASCFPLTENVVTFSAHARGLVASNTSRPKTPSSAFLREGIQTAPPSTFSQAPAPAPTSNNHKFHTLLGQLGMADSGVQQQVQPKTRIDREQEVKATRKAEHERQARKTEYIWDLPHEELTKRYLGQQRTLLQMPSGVEGPGQVITGPPMTPPVGYSSPFACLLGSVPRGPPPGIDTSFRPREYSWNLSGNQDPARHIISEEAWYGGVQAPQHRKEEEE